MCSVVSALHCSIVNDVVAVAVVDMAAPVADCFYVVVAVVVPLVVDADPAEVQPPPAQSASGIVRKCHPNLIQH